MEPTEKDVCSEDGGGVGLVFGVGRMGPEARHLLGAGCARAGFTLFGDGGDLINAGCASVQPIAGAMSAFISCSSPCVEVCNVWSESGVGLNSAHGFGPQTVVGVLASVWVLPCLIISFLDIFSHRKI